MIIVFEHSDMVKALSICILSIKDNYFAVGGFYI